MIAAALEASSYEPTIALRLGAETFEESLTSERAHASDLLPGFERLLERHAVRASDVERFVVGTGPGSFTGLRVAIALVLGLSRSTGAELACVPSTEAIAWTHLESGQQGAWVLDARGGEVYFARYARSADSIEVVETPRVAHPDELAGLIDDDVRVFCDEATERLPFVEGRENRVVGALPRADAVLHLGCERAPLPQGAVPEPLYLRPFAARVRKR